MNDLHLLTQAKKYLEEYKCDARTLSSTINRLENCVDVISNDDNWKGNIRAILVEAEIINSLDLSSGDAAQATLHSDEIRNLFEKITSYIDQKLRASV
jgi:hypothetical protein